MNIQAQTGNIRGSVRQAEKARIDGQIRAVGSIAGVVSKPVGYVDYVGDYEITPKFEAQALPTNQKVARSDIVVKEIPVTKIANSSGGNTVVIGS